MTQKRIPARRSRSSSGARPSGARSGGTSRPASGSSPHRPKRVRAGGTPPKPRKRRAPGSSAKTAAPPPTAPELTEKQRRHLRGIAHDLKPIIRLGNAGLTEAVAAETARALHDHELIKVKGPGGDREARDAMFAQLADRTASALVYRIGNIAVLFRPSATLSKILIPDGA